VRAIIRATMRKLTLSLCLLVTAAAFAEEAKKPLSPPAKAEAKIAGKNITIDYSAPSRRDRAIMGTLVPYGEVWRTGANAATTLTADSDIMLGTLHIPAGKYSLFTIPGEKEWTLIVNKQTGHSGSNYDAAQDFGRIKMKVAPVKETVETFVIDLKPTTTHRGMLTLTWENTQASIPVMVH
jgi:hypothetical protein